MKLGIENKTAVVAASSKGLGKAVARGLASEGVNLVIFSRNKDSIEETAKEISEEFGVDVHPVAADASVKEDLDTVFDEAEKRFSSIDILVNNAGGPPFGYLEDFDLDDWNDALKLNLLSTVHMTRRALPRMKKKRWGRIINITSISVKQPIDGLILSNTTRAGVAGFAKTVSAECGEFNITVNNVCPGRILTDRIKDLAAKKSKNQNISYESALDGMKEDIPLKRIGSPEEFADLVVFLASERAGYITGTTIQIDGGLSKSLL